MTIIELLNKKANGEKLPKFIKYQSEIWMYANWDGDYQSEDDGAYLFKEYQPLEMLNDEIEVVEPKAKIIEEDKKIKHINKTYDLTDFVKDYPEVAMAIRDIGKKQYEIIDYLNERGKQC